YDPCAPDERRGLPVAGPAVARLRRAAGRAARAVGLRRPSSDLQAKLAKTRAERDAARAKLAKAVAARDAQTHRAESLGAELERVRAEGAVASGRDRTDLSYLFLVTYGRSGSTLLQGILSSTPGVMIRGENGGVLQQLFLFHDTARGHRERLNRTEPLPPSHPWWGIDGYPEPTALRDIRMLLLETVLRPDPDTRVVGFKEIDWMTDRLPEQLEFVRAVFPGARFVLNTRDLEYVATSKWWARNPNALAELQAMEKQYVDALEAFGDDVCRVHYDDYVADPTALRGLFTWLGEDFDEDRVRAVMAVPHSY
ncbi:MAG TPA: sulfotransferase, partial [Vicinamibacterales bacterium]|nr:sulfotransferase [Vicinamibacterales bacterium]